MSQVGNIDKIAISFDMLRNYRVFEKGTKDVTISTNGVEMCNFIVVLCYGLW